MLRVGAFPETAFLAARTLRVTRAATALPVGERLATGALTLTRAAVKGLTTAACGTDARALAAGLARPARLDPADAISVEAGLAAAAIATTPAAATVRRVGLQIDTLPAAAGLARPARLVPAGALSVDAGPAVR